MSGGSGPGADALEVALGHRFPGGRELEIGFRAPLPGIVGLWGASGAGKSSVVRALAGVFRPDRCRISLGGAVLADGTRWVRPDRRRVGVVFQEGRLFPHLSVRGNLLFGARRAPRGAAGSGFDPGFEPGFEEVVALLGLDGLLRRRIRDLSGGEAQRVAIGRAILARPRILALDEPLAALDQARKREILPFLRRLRGTGMPMLYVTHSRTEAAALCDRIVVIEDGRVAEEGGAAAVLAGPLLGRRADAAALLEGRATGSGEGVVRIDAGGWELVASAAARDVAVDGAADGVGGGGRVRVLVPARAVVLLDGTGDGIAASARNLLPARVLTVDAGGSGAATVRLGPDGTGNGVLLARVTAESVRRLGIAPGKRLLAMVKAEAIVPAGEEEAGDG